MKKISVFLGILLFVFFTCLTYEELTLEELENFRAQGLEELLLKTVSKPWQGEEFVPGIAGGSWVSVMNEDPKSFNILIAEQDATTSAVVGNMLDWLLDYDVIKREWKPRIATPEVIVDEENNTMQVVYTFRDDLYWTYYNSPRRIKVTSDDIIFWYDEIEGDPEFQSSGYYGQFVIMPDGSEERVTISKIDDLTFAFNFPRIISEPFLMTNMNFGPRHLYEPAKLKGGVNEVRSIFSIAVNPRTIPSMGKWFLVEYSHGQRLVYKRNPDYWNKDINDVSIPYTDEMIVRIIPEENTQLLLFKNGSIESYRLRPEDISGLVNARVKNYTVFNAESALGAPFWTFNQNPVNTGKPSYEWFVLKEFRQAMSCLLNRERINSQVFRGLAEPKLDIFPGPNPFYNPEIKNQFLFDTERAIELLSFININRDSSGTMRDWENRPVEFDLTIRSESTMYQDTASIIVDELSKIGIKVNIRIVDFQKQVEQLFNTFDWDSTLIALSGANIFPSQGSNVWPSSGNLHLWHPNQEEPFTDWEARIDHLYNEGKFTLDETKAQEIWDEFQSILLDQLPIIHLLSSRGFWALNDRWDFTNVYFDNLNGVETNNVFLLE